jgi:hypothetical protein
VSEATTPPPLPLQLDYPKMVREALRMVVRQTLLQVVREGLAPPHQLYLTLATKAPNVHLPGFLRTAYPDEVTLVLEHQFWDLEVDDDGFSVTLRFGGAQHRIHAPFLALTAFVDAGAEFGLRFDAAGDAEAGPEFGELDEPGSRETEAAAEVPKGDGDVVDMAAFRRRRPRPDQN